MTSPIGHSVVGYVVSQFSGEREGRKPLYLIFLCLVVANIPDLDFIPGLLLNQPALFHGDILHSFGAAFLLCFGISIVLHLLGKPFLTIFYLSFAAYCSHLILDILSPDGRVPYGIPLLWPLSDRHYISPIPLFLGVHHASSSSASTLEFINGVLDTHNLLAISLELLILSPLLLLGYYIHRRNTSKAGAGLD